MKKKITKKWSSKLIFLNEKTNGIFKTPQIRNSITLLTLMVTWSAAAVFLSSVLIYATITFLFVF